MCTSFIRNTRPGSGLDFSHFRFFKNVKTIPVVPSSPARGMLRGTGLQGYLGYKKPSARGSVGRRVLILRKPRVFFLFQEDCVYMYRDTSRIRKRLPPGPYSRTMPRVRWFP